MLEKVERKIRGWASKWLSSGGRFILVQAVIQNIMVYWAHIFTIPKKVLQNIRKIIMNFIWNGKEDRGKIHLARWDLIMNPRSCRGWGLKDLDLYGRALIMKSMWRGMRSNGIWNEILVYKYLELADLERLYLMGWNYKKGGSTIINGFRNCWTTFHFFSWMEIWKWGYNSDWKYRT